MAVVVSDTSPIRALDHLGLIGLLRDLYATVLIPPGVYQELLNPNSSLISIDLSAYPFIQIQAPLDTDRVDHFLKNLDRGESEALALAIEVSARVILIDESRGREEARRLGLVPVGVLGTLLRAKQRGLISAISPLIGRLQIELRFFIAPNLKANVLQQAGESS